MTGVFLPVLKDLTVLKAAFPGFPPLHSAARAVCPCHGLSPAPACPGSAPPGLPDGSTRSHGLASQQYGLALGEVWGESELFDVFCLLFKIYGLSTSG